MPIQQISQEEVGAPKPDAKATPFDFRKPDRIPKSQLRAIRFLHENFVRSLTSSLSAYLRSYLSGNLVSVEQIPYTAFLDGLPPQTCMVSLTLLPYGGNAVLEIHPSLVFPILELLLGGKETSAKAVTRELTDMERHLLDNVFRIVAHDLEETWKGVADVEFKVDSMEAGRQFMRTLGPTEAVVVIGMEFSIADSSGMVNLAMPSITIKSMVQKFDQQWSAGKAEPEDSEQRRIMKLLKKAAVEVDSQLSSTMSVRDLLAMEMGSIVILDRDTDEPLAGLLNGKVKFSGQIVRAGRQRAFLIDAVEESD
jgi:flagellar motor switch protein FliM